MTDPRNEAMWRNRFILLNLTRIGGTVVVLISIEDTEEIARGAQLGGVADLVRKQDFGPKLLRRLWDAHGGSRPKGDAPPRGSRRG